ncbi:protein-methionine-sulfoxide reductase heme-binding subunit MsrQ [Shewanella eurypsychrophilus]|uniref:Protein-methionine-sulfoxide reductase heme-binding subunit MsrQ n=2 Tax=Shewanellaceae TaxID=267890 RepID=A0ABX6V7R0_9GAMM|nr:MULTISPECIES: protein-methionine-sulfoxide reductase heme-binding subunit MsrQ [Shewanella]QFU22602.1 protein-methionine-sulfoxide reductase heme-binding subunit MsrQ [Shewanella sp. YLB-09]QPG57891.1 protein-methionine-sulfoxide reductase heme-binding subunit MsrQ [Shewanella eurypsychrophilus]
MMRLTSKHLFWLKVIIHLVALWPIGYLVISVMAGDAGGDPVQYIIHYTGVGALNTLVILLMISPLARRLKQGILIQTRRLIGLYVFAYASLHILAFISLDLLFEWSLLFQEILKRPYILVGAVAYLILIALSITSLKVIRKKMGRRWQQLHNWVYLVAALVPIHFYWSVKSEIIEPSIYILIVIGLLSLRLSISKKLSQTMSRLRLKLSSQ